MQDVIIVGGSYSGMAAALQLLRARRRVLIIDAGLRRNRFADASHGFLGQDGVDPAKIAAQARAQLAKYPTLTWIEGVAERAKGAKDDFTIIDARGASYRARRILFATGVADALPPIEGIEQRWGKSIFHCPYCHAYELDRGRIGVIATGPLSIHQAQLLPEWGDITLLLNGASSLTDEQRVELAERRVQIEEIPIKRLEGKADVRLADERVLPFAGLFTASRTTPASPIARLLGCELEETLSGLQLKVGEAKETTVPGAFACGDVARWPHSVSLAVGDGAWAGAQVHRSLVF